MEAERKLQQRDIHENNIRQKFNLSPDVQFGDLAKYRKELAEENAELRNALREAKKKTWQFFTCEGCNITDIIINPEKPRMIHCGHCGYATLWPPEASVKEEIKALSQTAGQELLEKVKRYEEALELIQDKSTDKFAMVTAREALGVEE